MLKRYAFLVGSTEGVTPIPSVRDDLTLMKNYLMSCIGGGWNKDEIRIYLNKSAFDVLEHAEKLKQSSPDYFLFYWSGHGYADNRYQLLQPCEEEAIALECFFGVADRQLMILDTCRQYAQTISSRVNASCVSASDFFEYNRRRYRRVYDHYITKSEPSLQIAYACQAGGIAKASAYGSVFTTTLVDRALRWELPSRKRYGFASIRSLMRKPNRNGEQPGYYHSLGGVKPRNFPFAVGVYR